MSDQLIIDTLDFASNAGLLKGSISPSGFERLRSYLANDTGKLAYSVGGIFDEHERPMLRISVNGSINLKCQYCLERLEYHIDLKTDLFLARNEDELLRYDENIFIDAIPASEELDLLALVEDEVILGLPISPHHQDAAYQAEAVHKTHGDVSDTHPFIALASLKRTH